jgi:hypothetical protein
MIHFLHIILRYSGSDYEFSLACLLAAAAMERQMFTGKIISRMKNEILCKQKQSITKE